MRSALVALRSGEYLCLETSLKDLVIWIFLHFWGLFGGLDVMRLGLYTYMQWFPVDFHKFGQFWGWFLRDETGLGRGVHRFWGCLIQKSRSLFGHFSRFFPIFWIFGVGVVYSGIPPVMGSGMGLECENMWVGTVIFYCRKLWELILVLFGGIWTLWCRFGVINSGFV